MRGEDAQLDLREADLQVLKVVSFGRSCILVGLLVKVLSHLLQLCFHKKVDLHSCPSCLLTHHININREVQPVTHPPLSARIQRS